MRSDSSQNIVECSDAKSFVIWHSDALFERFICIQSNMASGLMYLRVAPVFAEGFTQLAAAKIPGKFHAYARTSSRT